MIDKQQIPQRLAHLRIDRRGYPIPWNVLCADDGTPFFTINDDRKTKRALKLQLCPICGERLGSWRWFVGGPLSAFALHGQYLDLPGHYECITFALQTCPYLAMPKYLRRVDVANPGKLPQGAHVLLDEMMIPERPALFVIVAGSAIELTVRPLLAPYVRPLPPLRGYEFWQYGKKITEAEALPMLRSALGAEWNLPEIAV